jgi:hypothetical protein
MENTGAGMFNVGEKTMPTNQNLVQLDVPWLLSGVLTISYCHLVDVGIIDNVDQECRECFEEFPVRLR